MTKRSHTRTAKTTALFGASSMALALALAAPMMLDPGRALAADAAPAAAAGDQDQSKVSEVVVTAQFRSQNLQKTPIAITAVTAQMLETRGQATVGDIANQAPNVTLKPAPGPFGPALQSFIRGVGQTDFNPAESPGVGMYVDDVYYGTITGTDFNLLDLDRVEVLRGPQGTLSGQNSIGGSIKLFSKKPNGDDGGDVELTYGSYNKLEAKGAADFTVIPDQLFVRIAGYADQQQGYVTRYDYACTHPGTTVPSIVNGTSCVLGHEGGVSTDAGRIAVRWTPTPKLEVNVNADYTSNNSEASPLTLLYVGTNTATGVSAPITAKKQIGGVTLGNSTGSPFISYSPFGSYAQDTFSHSAYTNYSTYCDPSPSDGSAAYCDPAQSTMHGGGVSGDINYKINDSVALRSITAYRYFSADWSTDEDGSPVGDTLVHDRTQHRQFSEELRLTGDLLNDTVHYTLGGFYFDENTKYDGRIDLASFEFLEHDNVPATTKAGFVNVDWNATDKLEFSGGLRYTQQDKTFTFGRLGVPGITGGPNAAGGPPYAPCPQAGGAVVDVAVCPLNGSSGTFSASHVDYRAAVQYQWTSNFMTYASVSTGFKGGGVNPRPFYVQQEIPFGPETITAYEAGIKSTWFDRRLQVNAAAFYSNYDAIQITVNNCPVPAPFNAPCAAPINGGNAVVQGLEFEGQLHPVQGLTIDGSVSYLDFHFSSLTAAATASGMTLSTQTPFAPKWKYALGAQYEIPMNGVGTLTPRLDLSYQSSFYSQVPNTVFSQVSGYTLLNGTLTWRPTASKWQVGLVVTNLTNQIYYYGLFDNRGSASAVMGEPAPPREWQLTVKRTF